MVIRHALRNALVPVVTLGALELGTLLSGAVLTEQVFSIPGFGKLVVDAVFNRDYPVVQGVVMVTATLYILLNLLADVLYVWSTRGCGSHERRTRPRPPSPASAGRPRARPGRRGPAGARPGAVRPAAGGGVRPGRHPALRRRGPARAP